MSVVLLSLESTSRAECPNLLSDLFVCYQLLYECGRCLNLCSIFGQIHLLELVALQLLFVTELVVVIAEHYLEMRGHLLLGQLIDWPVFGL